LKPPTSYNVLRRFEEYDAAFLCSEPKPGSIAASEKGPPMGRHGAILGGDRRAK
jgi:hypothetical protein